MAERPCESNEVGHEAELRQGKWIFQVEIWDPQMSWNGFYALINWIIL